MRRELLPYLACPSCGSDLELAVAEEADGEILGGVLSCGGCPARYEILRGVPRLNEAMSGLERVAESFTFEWKAHLDGRLEQDTVFGRSTAEEWAYFQEATGVDGAELRGIVALDAGCGPAQVTRLIGEHGAEAAIGMDMNDAIEDAFLRCRGHSNVHIVQGNVFAPPFKPALFDLIWCNGVIHHTPDARGGHRSLSRFVKPGGVLYVWVYARRFNPFRFTRDVLAFLQVTRLPNRALLAVAKALSVLSLAFLRPYQAVRRLPGLRPSSRWGERKVRNRTLKELELTWLDSLSPQYDTRHSEAEVIGWFRDLGFEDVRAIEEPKVGVRGVLPAAR
jgi:SAM-dependent methyltransferase/uncharacterized protein YbaR (Trm112 family)